MPTPPPNAFPSTFAIKGLGNSNILFNKFANFVASLIRVFRSEKICSFIQSKSPPAQNDFPVDEIINAFVF